MPVTHQRDSTVPPFGASSLEAREALDLLTAELTPPALRELAAIPQWVCWRSEVRDGSPTKVPYRPSGARARTNNPSTWSSYDECLAALGGGSYSGVGFVLWTDDPYVLVDLDHCLDAQGRPTDMALDVVRMLGSYTEISPSGDGLHVLCRGVMPARRNRPGIEIYDSGRYATVTGRLWPDSPTEEIREATDALRAVCGRYAPKGNGSAVRDERRTDDGSDERIREGGRHNALTSFTVKCRKVGMSQSEILVAALAHNAEHCVPPLPEAEVMDVVKWAARGVEPDADPRPRITNLLELAPTPDELRELAAAPPIVPLATHLLYPRTTTVLAGQTNVGKTTAALRVSLDLGYGREPWTGRHDGREPLRILYVSRDDTTRSLVAKLAQLAPDDAWTDGRITLIGKEKRTGVVLDDAGVGVLRNTMADGRFDVLVIDPYAHLLPPGLSVNDDEAARGTIDRLDRLCDSLGTSALLIHHPRKRGPNGKDPMAMTKSERIEEVRGSSVLVQLARAVATLWETGPSYRMLDALVNDVPPLVELHFETTPVGESGLRWELAGPPSDAEAEALRSRLLDLEPGPYTFSHLARWVFDLNGKPSGKRRTQVKALARQLAEAHPARFRLHDRGVEVRAGDDPDQLDLDPRETQP